MTTQIGDEVTLLDMVTKKEVVCIVLDVVDKGTHYNLLVRRKNNHPFRDGKHSKWIKEEK